MSALSILDHAEMLRQTRLAEVKRLGGVPHKCRDQRPRPRPQPGITRARVLLTEATHDALRLFVRAAEAKRKSRRKTPSNIVDLFNGG
jgi:hypothetical protein